MSGLTRLFPLKILPSNPTRKKPSFITLFPSFCIYLLCSSSVSISKNCVSELHQLKPPPFTIQNIKNSLQFPPSLPKSIIFYNFVQKYLISKIQAYLSTEITKKNLFSSIHSQKCIHLPTILPLLFILAPKIRGGEEKRRRKLRESSAAIHCLTTNDDGTTNSFPSSRSFQPTSNRSPKWALSPTWSR